METLDLNIRGFDVAAANSPSGSALANFLLNGTRSRLGRLCTNLSVCDMPRIARCVSCARSILMCCSWTNVLACDRLDDIVWGSTQQFRDNGELVHVYAIHFRRKSALGSEGVVKEYQRSFPGNNGFPSNISAKMHPVLQMSTATRPDSAHIPASVESRAYPQHRTSAMST